MSDVQNNPGYLDRMVHESQAFQIYLRRVTLDTLLSVFDRNAHELRTFLRDAVKPENTYLFMRREEGVVILREIIRLFHNFVASAKMLIDNMRPLIRKWYKNTSFLTAYELEVKRRFVNNKLSFFIEDLRNYVLHYSLPVTTAFVRVTIDPATGQQNEVAHITLNKESLLLWKNWDKGKAFLKQADNEIDLLAIVESYYTQVIEFHVWMHDAFDKFHAEEFAWLDMMEHRIKELLKPLDPSGSTSIDPK